MGRFITDLKDLFRRGNVLTRFIYVNVAVFVVVELVNVILLLFNRMAPQVFDLLALPASVTRFLMQPWSILTYMFMHAGVMHILFNMLWLYWFGQIFLTFFSAKHFRGVYFLGGILGGLLYMLAYNLFPYFQTTVHHALLVGASASALAIATATAYREPNYPIQLLFIGTVRLKYLALFMVLTDLLFMTSGNAGGHISHLGGALAGLWFAAALQKGTDLTSWINKGLDAVSGLFEGKTWKRKPKMKIHYGGKSAAGQQNRSANKADFKVYNAREEEEKINRILEKVKQSGYESLTQDEKKTLFDASRK